MKNTSASPSIRHPVCAGTFYPDNPAELRQMVEGFLSTGSDVNEDPGKAYVLPHAGYVYSGSVAGVGYRRLLQERDKVERVLLLGPSHHIAFQGLAISQHDAFATPLGHVAVDREALATIGNLPQVIQMDQAHSREHSIEVHLPFLQVVLNNFRLVPLVVGQVEEGEVAQVLDLLWGGPETRVIVSSDLSHYHDYDTACRIDRETACRVEKLLRVTPDQACGAVPLDGLLHVVRARAMRIRTLDLRNSGDTAGGKDRVVGYGAFAAA